MLAASSPSDVELNDRQRDILIACIEEYIATAEPVGSRTLTKRKALDVSPATVRNVMADLDELGLLSAPHASAGRVPTPRAFRLYVERLAQRGRISPKERELISAITVRANNESNDIQGVLEEAGRVLSTVSKHATLVLMPSLDDVVFQRIEFVPIREDAVLAVFVAKSGLIQQRLVEVTFRTDRDELTTMSNYLNSLLGGKPLAEVRREVLTAMHDARTAADKIMRHALFLGERALSAPPVGRVVVEGERTLLDQPEFADIERMRKLLRAFEEKTMILRLLDAATTTPIESQAAVSELTTVVLGSETSMKDIKDLAAVTATYASEDGPAGRVSVVGPTRMNYARVIPLVEMTADALSQSLGTEGPSDPEPD